MQNRSTTPYKMTLACKNHAQSTTCKMISGMDLHRRLNGSPTLTNTMLLSLPLWRHSPTAWAHRRKSRLDQKLDIYLSDTPSQSQHSSLRKATCCGAEENGRSAIASRWRRKIHDAALDRGGAEISTVGTCTCKPTTNS